MLLKRNSSGLCVKTPTNPSRICFTSLNESVLHNQTVFSAPCIESTAATASVQLQYYALFQLRRIRDFRGIRNANTGLSYASKMICFVEFYRNLSCIIVQKQFHIHSANQNVLISGVLDLTGNPSCRLHPSSSFCAQLRSRIECVIPLESEL
jgi:hypothetical protein